MSQKIYRVPYDFDWPLNQKWEGFLRPDKFDETPCPDCKNGLSPQAQHLLDLWYGDLPFDPTSTGSTPLGYDTPTVRMFAERNIRKAPDFYGVDEAAIVSEARRLAALWNGQWSHHLSQEDVNALVTAGRLMEFTHTWDPEHGWKKVDPPIVPTAKAVNEWSLYGFGHDAINADIVIRTRCERNDIDHECQLCRGYRSIEKYAGQRAEAEAWEPTDPPTGEGWQLWETVSEGSPITPVFLTADALVTYLCNKMGFNTTAARTLIERGFTIGSFIMVGSSLLQGAEDADIINALGNPDVVFTDDDLAAATIEHNIREG